MSEKINFDNLPSGTASDRITKGCLVIEGGAFRGVYAQGIVDLLMKEDINFESTIGCSAGALTGMNYVSGQIGRSIKINLKYRHDSRYVGLRALAHDRGLIGFDFVLNGVNQYDPFDQARFFGKERRFVAVATDLAKGQAHYFDKATTPDFLTALKASASMPFISKPVMVGKELFLDGGVTDSIPYQWAIDQGYQKVVVIRTRENTYRKSTEKHSNLLKHAKLLKQYPAFEQALTNRPNMYNRQCDLLDELVETGRVFRFSPKEPLTVGRLEGNIAKLEKLYWQGYQDAKELLPSLVDYLNKA